MILAVICLKKNDGITYFMIKIYLKIASLPRSFRHKHKMVCI